MKNENNHTRRTASIKPLNLDLTTCVLVFALAALMFANSANNAFVWDDHDLIENAREIRAPLDWKTILTGAPHDIYRPFRTVVYAATRIFSGDSPPGYHLVNIFLNSLFSVLLYMIARGLFGAPLIAFAAAALFSVHPVHSEAVAYISGLADVLAGVLMAASLLCLWESAGRVSAIRRLFAYALFTLALFSKEVSIVFPLLVLALDTLVLREPVRLKLFIKRLPLFLMSAVYVLIRFYYIHVVEQARLIYGWGSHTVVPSVIKLIPYYLKELTYPAALCPDFNAFRLAHGFGTPAVWGTIVGVAASAALLAACRKRFPAIAFGAAWFAVMLLPVMQIIPTGTFCADRYLYMPSAGFCIALAGLLSAAANRAGRTPLARSALFALPSAAIALSWAIRTPAQNLVWRNDVTLYRTMTQCAPRSYYAHNLLGGELANQNRFAEAEEALLKAAAIHPGSAVIQMNIGQAYGAQGKYIQAETAFTTAYRLDPSKVEVLLFIGLAREQAGRRAEAADAYEMYLKLRPGDKGTALRLRNLLENEAK